MLCKSITISSKSVAFDWGLDVLRHADWLMLCKGITISSKSVDLDWGLSVKRHADWLALEAKDSQTVVQ